LWRAGFFWFEVESGEWGWGMVRGSFGLRWRVEGGWWGMWGWVGWMDGWAEEVKMMEKRRRVHKIVHVHNFYVFT